LSNLKERRRAVAARLAELDVIEVEIEKLVWGGDGFARFEGIPIFVPRTAPGDRVRVQLVDQKADFARAEVRELLTASADRREPPCAHYRECGGCDLQHIEDERQIELKVAAALETLRRLGRIEVDPAQVEIVSGVPWGYRLRTQVHSKPIPEDELLVDEPGVAVGYYGRRTRNLVPVTQCPVLVPALEREVVGLSSKLRADAPRRIDLAIGDGDRVSASPVSSGLAHGPIEVRVGSFTYEFDARCFFQSHVELLPRLVELAVGEAEGDAAFDLYCGVGLFSLPLAERYQSVTAVDGDRVAMRYARKNGRQATRSIEWVTQAVESWIDEIPEGGSRILVDPPRNGLHARVSVMLTKRPVERLTYVSCNAATLARDLGILGRCYAVESVAFVDLFPQTGHLETVVQMVPAR